MLRILDNPRQDIPLAAVLKSPIAGLTDEELGRLRAHDRSVPFCECVLARCRGNLRRVKNLWRKVMRKTVGVLEAV